MRSFQVVSGEAGYAQQFTNLRRDAAGGAICLPHQMLGYFTLSTNPTNGKTLTLTVNGTAIVLTGTTGTPTNPGDFKIAGTAALTAANIYALLNQPQTTTANGIALSGANQQLLSYLSYSLSGTILYLTSNNTSLYAPLSSFTGATDATSDTFTAQTMQLYVEPGVVYVSGTRVIFAGGSAPTVTAPASHPRIDVLTIDNAGTLAWTTGTESASPVAPAYPANKVALCEVYNVVGETALYDYENQTSGQGYIYNDVRPFMQPSMNWTAFTSDLIPDADGTRNLGSGSEQWDNVYAKTAIYLDGIPIGSGKFGGTGADGALSISSGTTTIDCANAAVVVKNYTSISITGTGKLAFSNPNTNGTIIILKSQGGVTLTSSAAPMIDASSMGAAGGAALTFSASASGATGNTGSPGYAQIVSTNPGTGGVGTTSAGLAGAIASFLARDISAYLLKYISAWVGAGGGSGGVFSGSNNSATSGVGGTGGGTLIIECAGAWNFTTSGGISVAGAPGGTGTTTSSTFSTSAGGGGGAGGFFLALYGSLTANSGTVTVSGGTGGNSSLGTNGPPYGGGGGSNAHATGSNSTSGGSATKTGGDGATGLALIAANTEFS